MPQACCKNTWAKIPEDEPVFILRGKDLLAAEVVRDWIERAVLRGVNADKLTRALQHAEAMEAFRREYPERCKLPD